MRDLAIRSLAQDDHAAVCALLERTRDETMFLRSNLHAAGFAYEGKPRQAKYFGAFDAQTLVGVAALCWNGMVLMHAPRGAPQLFVALVREAMTNGPDISGFNGASDQVFALRGMLDLGSLSIALDIVSDLFALDVGALKMPSGCEGPGTVLRRPREEDLPVLVDWEIGYRVEALNDLSAPDRRDEIELATAAALRRGIDNTWLLQRDGVLVSRAMFGASLPDMVQIGGVWTPPHARGRGYGRTVVAASLVNARANGINRAVLFAHDPQAIRAYTAIGFQKVGAYRLVIFERPVAATRLWRLLNALPSLHRPIAA